MVYRYDRLVISFSRCGGGGVEPMCVFEIPPPSLYYESGGDKKTVNVI